jgi:hypothetical protein
MQPATACPTLFPAAALMLPTRAMSNHVSMGLPQSNTEILNCPVCDATQDPRECAVDYQIRQHHPTSQHTDRWAPTSQHMNELMLVRMLLNDQWRKHRCCHRRAVVNTGRLRQRGIVYVAFTDYVAILQILRDYSVDYVTILQISCGSAVPTNLQNMLFSRLVVHAGIHSTEFGILQIFRRPICRLAYSTDWSPQIVRFRPRCDA